MKKYRVWAYDKISYYVDLSAINKSDAYTRAMDVNVLDWRQGDDSDYPDLNIKKRDIEEIKKEKSWSKGYKKWRENNEN